MSQRHLIDQLRDQVRNPRNRLEVHGLAFRMNGFPIYASDELGVIYDVDTDEPEQVGEVSEPLWDWEGNLTGDDRAYFWLMLRTIQGGLKRYGSEKDRAYFTHPRVMSILIEEYGIKCWHYEAHRRPQFATDPPFECLVCNNLVFANRPQTEEEAYVFRNRDKISYLANRLGEKK